ncbi:MAG: hypothetical protein U1G08_00660 [Verrucomicrobiota bacterium]
MAQDYILRLIEQVAAMLATVLARRRSGQVSEAGDEIRRLTQETVGLTPEAVRRLSPEAVATLLDRSGFLRPLKSLVLVGLLEQEDELAGPEWPEADRLASRVHRFCLLADTLPLLNREDQQVSHQQLEVLAQELGPACEHPALRDRIQKIRRQNGPERPAL